MQQAAQRAGIARTRLRECRVGGEVGEGMHGRLALGDAFEAGTQQVERAQLPTRDAARGLPGAEFVQSGGGHAPPGSGLLIVTEVLR